MPALVQHGIAAYEVSCDPVELLAQFAHAYDVAYPLLADAGSRVIRQLGLLNTYIPAGHPWHGVPYPGTLLLDADGRIFAKSFYAPHGIRDSIVRLLEDGFGVAPAAAGIARPATTSRTAGLMATATLSAGMIRPGQVHTFVLTVTPQLGHEQEMEVLAAPAASALTFAPVEGVTFGPVAAVVANGALVLRASVTAARRREDFVLDATLHLGGDPCVAPVTVTLSLPVRALPNAAPVVEAGVAD